MIVCVDELSGMTLEQLRIFLAVAETQHVTRAAGRLNLTQSAVSAAISALEQRYGVVLFDRIGRGIELNSAGQVFVAEAQRIVDEVTRAQVILTDLSGTPSGRLSIAASQTVASYWLPSMLVRYAARFPKVELHLTAGNTATVADAVRQGEVDIGVVEGVPNAEGLLTDAIARDQLALVVGPGHPWADGRIVRVRDLAGSTWIMRETGSGTRAAFHEELVTLGLEPATLHVLMELPSNEACLAAVAAGDSAAVLSRRAAATAIEAKRVHEIRFPLSVRNFTALRHPRRHASLAQREMMALFHDDMTKAQSPASK